jgi:signal transduction histidine kinase
MEAAMVLATDLIGYEQAENQARAAEHAAQALAYQQLERHVEERTHELERRRQVAESLRDILTVLNSDRPMAAILDAIVGQAARLLEADAVAIFQVSADHMLAVQASVGLSVEELAVLLLPVGLSATGQAVAKRRPVVIATDTADFKRIVEQHKSGRMPAQQAVIDLLAARIHTLLSVPLMIKDEMYGAISLYYCAPRAFTGEEVSLALAFGDQAALAIENARLRERAEQAAVLQERARFARDLHDSVTQSLYSLALFAEAAHRLATAGNTQRAAHYMERLRITVQQALQEMRLMVHQLRPHVLEHEGLAGALQQRLDAVERRAGLQARLLVEGQLDLPAAIEAELYYIAQEALNNALKHAAATAVTVNLSVVGAEMGSCVIRLEVADDGCGFDPQAIGNHGGQGLISLRERAAKLGGTVHIDSAPGAGTRVTVDCRLQIARDLNLQSAI